MSNHPTLDEVKAYVAEKGYHFDAEHFYDYYSASGWKMQSGKPVKSWRQCCVTWERNDRSGRGERDERAIPESLRAYDF